jgi:hypothetical protein
MAPVRAGVVCWVHDAGDWEFVEGGDSYVPLILFSSLAYEEPSGVGGNTLLTIKKRIGFVAYDQYKALLSDADGKISGPRTVIAGFGAGVTESLLAVTPFESIKTIL